METAVQRRKKVRQEEEVSPPISTITPAIVLENVFKILGKPGNMSMVSPSLTRATPISKYQFRVNIYTRQIENGEFSEHKLSHSYFVHVDDKGQIKTSYPEIHKHYE